MSVTNDSASSGLSFEGTGLDLPLERWLFEHTFPLEARYADEAFAVEV